MKRITAAKRIKTHLRDYRERLGGDSATKLSGCVRCPLCVVGRPKGHGLCGSCLRWPGRDTDCFDFMDHVNRLETVKSKLRWIDKLEAELDRWASEEKS